MAKTKKSVKYSNKRDQPKDLICLIWKYKLVKPFKTPSTITMEKIKKSHGPFQINRVIEIPLGKEKPATLVYVNFRSSRTLLTNLYKKLVNDLEKKLKTTVLIVAARNIESRWIKANRTQQRSYSRTLTNVY